MSGSWLWGRGFPPPESCRRIAVSQDCRVTGLPCFWIQVGVHFPDGYLSGQLPPLRVWSWCAHHHHRGVISPFSPGPAAAASHGAGTGRQLRPCYSFGDSFTSPGDSRQQASIIRTVPVMA